jgi:hypothetical protein
MSPPLLLPKMAAERLGVSTKTLNGYVQGGELRYINVGSGGVRQREADNRLSATSAMMTWCVDRGTLMANHLRGFKRLYLADRSEIIWLPERIAAWTHGEGALPTVDAAKDAAQQHYETA